MALIKEYEDSSGNSHDASYWRTVTINIGAYDHKIQVVFYGWRDGQAFADGLKPLRDAVKKYVITGQEFMAVAATPPVGGSLYDILAYAAESYALGKKDTTMGGIGPDGKPILVSFFEGATRV